VYASDPGGQEQVDGILGDERRRAWGAARLMVTADTMSRADEGESRRWIRACPH